MRSGRYATPQNFQIHEQNGCILCNPQTATNIRRILWLGTGFRSVMTNNHSSSVCRTKYKGKVQVKQFELTFVGVSPARLLLWFLHFFKHATTGALVLWPPRVSTGWRPIHCTFHVAEERRPFTTRPITQPPVHTVVVHLVMERMVYLHQQQQVCNQ